MEEHNDKWKDEIAIELKARTKWSVCVLIDGGFMALWVLAQWLLNEKVIAKLQLLSVYDKLTLSVFQFIFAISTLAPILLYIYVDIRIMIIRARKKIRYEEKLVSSNANE